MRRLLAATSAATGVDVADIAGRSMKRRHFWPRCVAMWLCREFAGASYPAIGHVFDRDHTTVLNACARVGLELLHDPELRAELDRIAATAGFDPERRRAS